MIKLYPFKLNLLLLLWVFGCVTIAPSQITYASSLPTIVQGDSGLYRLGPGDRVKITVYEAPEFSGDFEVLLDGTLGLGEAGTVDVSGLTLDEATNALTKHYLRLLQDPIVNLSLIRNRAVRVAIAGEVGRPGVYTLGSPNVGVADVQRGEVALTSQEQPTLTKLIQQAGGITQTADIRNIVLERQGGRGQGLISQNIDLWQLLQGTDLNQDPILRDGDRIRIPTAVAVKPEELRNLSQASFAPATMSVNVVGEVVKPGVMDLPTNTPLNQAILAAGGFSDRSERSNVELIRIEPNGSITKRKIAIDFKMSPNEQQNPLLRPNDMVVVPRNGITAFGDNIKNFVGTFLPLTNLRQLLGI